MAILPTPEELAREILEIFVGHFKRRPDQALRINNFLAVWNTRGLRAEDFKIGMEFAISTGWVEAASDSTFKITSAGFAQA